MLKQHQVRQNKRQFNQITGAKANKQRLLHQKIINRQLLKTEERQRQNNQANQVEAIKVVQMEEQLLLKKQKRHKNQHQIMIQLDV